MEINELIRECHKTACDKGFWDEKNGCGNFNTAEKLMLIVSELGEACEAIRKNKFQLKNNPWEKDTFQDEIADTVIRIVDLCGRLHIDLEWQLKNKMNYNKKRPYKHGKAF